MSTKFTNDMWRMPRNANQSKSSNYSWNYSVNAKFNISSPANAGITSSISFWFKRAVVTNVSQPYEINNTYGMWMSNTTMYIKYGSSGYQTVDSATGLTQDGLNALTSTDWVHWVLIREATATSTAQNFKMYANTKEVFSSSSPPNFGTNNTEVNMIWATNQSQSTSIDSFSVFNYALSPSQITTLYGSSSIGIGNPMSLSPKPVAYYSLGEYEAYNGANYLTPNDSLKDYVFDFDSSNNNYINCGDSDIFSFVNGTTDSPFSISAWINMTDATQFRIANKFSNSVGREYIFTTSAADIIALNLYDQSSGGRIGKKYNTPLTSYQGQWIHVVCTYDGTASSSGIKIYLNSSQVDDSNSDVSPYTAMENTNQPFLIGQQDGTYANGKISNTAIFNTELTSSEVTTLYNYGSPIQTLSNIPQNSNLKAWYKLDASEVYNSSTTEWSIDNNQNPSAYPSSLNFNGSSDYIDCGDSDDFSFGDTTTDSPFSLSAWVNMTDATKFRILNKAQGTSAGNTKEYLFSTGGDDKIIFYLYQDNISTTRIGQKYNGAALTSYEGQWIHLVGTYDGSSSANGIKIYLNGIQVADTPVTGTYTAMQNTNEPFLIGKLTSDYANGKISNAKIFNTALSQSDVTSLYNNGTPLSDMSSFTSLVSWYKLNNTTTGIQDSKRSNNGTNNGATEYPGFVNTLVGDSLGMSQANLVQSDLSFTSSYSPYALNFDGANDYIQIPYNANLTPQNGNFTISAWINTDNLSGWHPIWCTQNLSSGTSVTALHTYGNKVRATVGGSTNNPSYGGSWALFLDSTQSLTTSTWYHIAVTFNMSGNAQIYINGSADNSGPIENPQTSWNTGDRFIGDGEGFWDGKISNISIWNTALTSAQVTEIYNEGVPSNLNNHSAYSNLASWWQLGSNTYWADPYWIALDEKGTNNGQSQNIAAPTRSIISKFVPIPFA